MAIALQSAIVGTAHELVGAAVHGCDIDAKFFEKLSGVDKLSADDADGTNEAVAIGDDLIGSGRNVISAGRAVVFAVCVDRATSFFLINPSAPGTFRRSHKRRRLVN